MVERKYKTRSIDTHDFLEDARLQGKIQVVEEIEVDEEKRMTMIIDTGDRLARIFKSKALEEAFDVAVKGDCISLHLLGIKPLKGAKTFKRFSVAVWEGDCGKPTEETQGD